MLSLSIICDFSELSKRRVKVFGNGDRGSGRPTFAEATARQAWTGSQTVSEWRIPESISAAMFARVCSRSIAAINHAS